MPAAKLSSECARTRTRIYNSLARLQLQCFQLRPHQA